jgi:hypothetical protein
MRKLIPLLLAVLIFGSCQQRPLSGTVSGSSPDGKTTISATAVRKASLDPFTVTMEVKTVSESQGSLQFEVAASAIDSSDVKFDWKDNNNCIITFIQSDNEKRIFRYYATATNVILQEVKE